MRKSNTIAAILLLIAWGAINEYVHMLFNYLMVPAGKGFTIPMFQAIVFLITFSMISAAVWIAFNDEVARK